MSTPAELPRRLGLFDSVCLVIGTVIGGGIFLVPGTIARDLPSLPIMLLTWVVAGAFSLLGALAYAELGAMLPESGGQYVYLREAYGPLSAFLCGWTFFLVIQSGAIAAVSVGFSIYLSYLIPRVPGVTFWAPPLLIAILTAVNYRGVRAGARVQNTFTALKVLGIALLIGSAFASRAPAAWDWSLHAGSVSMTNAGLAMLGCFVAYDGWHAIAFVAGEVREPRRNLPLALGGGVAAVIVIYLLANLAYTRVLPMSELAATARPAAATAERTMGSLGAALVTWTILLSTIGAANGSILTSPRIYFAQARDGLFFERMARIHPRYETPSFAILVQGAWAAVLAASGSYEILIAYVLFISWIVHAMCVFGVLILRRRRPDASRPYKLWGYPVTPLLFVAFAVWFVLNTLVERPVSSLGGVILAASGIPVYYGWRRKRGKAGSPVVK
ncbi:MAG: amino acid permease [Bryobacteraceae bacterium]